MSRFAVDRDVLFPISTFRIPFDTSITYITLFAPLPVNATLLARLNIVPLLAASNIETKLLEGLAGSNR